ncbi:MAG: response regulator [Deltaproteobacteria bacterium]|nr:response regulator [Deltaproteobacteria bacterium]NNK86071.1 response regulator [Desulfobacterales bacterium]
MNKNDLLTGKKVLIVDDEPDILETLSDLLEMCEITEASSFGQAKGLLETQPFDLAILDIMGVSGYEILKIATEKNITAVMLTAYALTPEDVAKSHKGGAAYYIPKEQMVNITTFLNDILKAKQEGKNTWNGWFSRMASFCEKKFGQDWQESDKEFWERFPFH